MLLFNLCFLLNIASSLGSYIIHSCDDFNSQNKCITNWNCMWCNNSYIENNTIVHESTCNTINPCHITEDNNKNCVYKFEHKYDLQCKIGNTVEYILLLVGFYLSIIIIYGTLNKVILHDDTISPYVRKSLNMMIFILITVPLVVMFFTNQIIFNFLFTSYIMSAICIYCCIQANNYKSDVSEKSYDRIN